MLDSQFVGELESTIPGPRPTKCDVTVRTIHFTKSKKVDTVITIESMTHISGSHYNPYLRSRPPSHHIIIILLFFRAPILHPQSKLRVLK